MIGCDYFESEYQPAHMLLNTGSNLPDFSNDNNVDSVEELHYNMTNGNPQVHILKSGGVNRIEEDSKIVNGNIYFEYE